MNQYLIISIYFVAVNLAGLMAMFIDKKKAIEGRFRIPERTLFLIAAAGGSIGSILGMYMAHHKTKHSKFTIGLPVILILQICLCMYVLLKAKI